MSGKILVFERSNFFLFPLLLLFSKSENSFLTFYRHESCCIGRILCMKLNSKLMSVRFSRNSILFVSYEPPPILS